jgi:hypothetical protein
MLFGDIANIICNSLTAILQQSINRTCLQIKLKEKKRRQVTKAADNGVEGEAGDGDHDHGDQKRHVQDQLPNFNTGYRTKQ